MCGESCGPGGPVWSLGVCESSWLRGRGLEGLVGMVGLMGPVGLAGRPSWLVERCVLGM